MKLEAINAIKEKALPKSALKNSINYMKSQIKDNSKPDVLETISQDNKGAKLDKKA
jgi:hypothetical protein